MSITELEQNVATQSSVDLVTIASAPHWFDLRQFYKQVKWVLKKPSGVIAAWTYTMPEINESVGAVFKPFDTIDCKSFWAPQRKLVDNKYMSIDFPFEPVDGYENTGPFDQFVVEKLMDLDDYFKFIRSCSAYQKANDKGVELLTENVMEKFKAAWNEDGQSQKIARFRVYLRIGKKQIVTNLQKQIIDSFQSPRTDFQEPSRTYRNKEELITGTFTNAS
ncbi:hypothetical protein WN943_027075 [Citrus x changshan-huyou]